MNSLEPLSRRTLLRGAGAALGLPYLERMVPRRGVQDGPARMVFLFMPNGVLPQAWTPIDVGPAWSPTPSLSPLTHHMARTQVLTGLRNKNSMEGEGHYVKTTALLSGEKVHKTGGRDLRVGTSVDQVAAHAVGTETRIPSLVLGLEGVRHAVDMGYSTVYGSHISWRTPTQPAMKETEPRLVFDRLFRSSKRRLGDSSVLDIVAEETASLQRKLGGADTDKLGEYLESVRELERRLERFETSMEGVPSEEPADPGHHEVRSEWFLDLIALAIEADSTRVASLMFGNAVGGTNFSFIDGVEGGHHHLSHHEKDPSKMDQYQRINRWHVARMAGLLDRLSVKRELDGDLLDRTMVFLGSGLRDGDRHDPNDLPILLAGGQALGVAAGEHRRYRKNTPLCELYISMLKAFGVPTSTFGDAEQPLRGVLTV
ncbi:MAG: hypothetical protein CL933_19180 [Deltaproteobacteria bacterium]|nr:hypothetical protein [Deltaproteobacteria bacterium]